MAIAFDAASTGTPVTWTSLTYSHTVGSISNWLLVVVVYSSADSITWVTYNWTSMTQAAKYFDGYWTYIFILYNPPTWSAYDIVVTSSSSKVLKSSCASYSWVKQSWQPDSNGGAAWYSSTIAVSTTTVADNCWVIWAIMAKSAWLNTAWSWTTLRTNDTSLWLADNNAAKTPAWSVTLNANPYWLWDWYCSIISIAPYVVVPFWTAQQSKRYRKREILWKIDNVWAVA